MKTPIAATLLACLAPMWVAAGDPLLPIAKAPFDTAQAQAHQAAWSRRLATPVETTNTAGAKMLLIPPGEFLMGSTDEQVAAAMKVAEEINADASLKDHIQNGERPQHRVVIAKPFLMGATAVTIGQFKEFAAASGYVTEPEIDEKKAAAPAPTAPAPPNAAPKPILTYLHPGYPITDHLPASRITWNDSVAYSNWLSERENLHPCYRQEANAWVLAPGMNGYRLPTEAEWEMACRAGTTTQYSYGDDAGRLDDYAWYKMNSEGRAHPVGKKLPNSFGLYDMHGNIQVWCQDFYDTKWYTASPVNDPSGPDTGSLRVLRGGNCTSFSSKCRSATRNLSKPSPRLWTSGFRYVRTLL